MRIPVLFALTLFGISTTVPCALAQNDDVSIILQSSTTAADEQKTTAAITFCEAGRIGMKIARIDPAYVWFMQSCLRRMPQGASAQAVMPNIDYSTSPNTDRKETMDEATQICRSYVESREREVDLPYPWLAYDATNELPRCLAAEMPQ